MADYDGRRHLEDICESVVRCSMCGIKMYTHDYYEPHPLTSELICADCFDEMVSACWSGHINKNLRAVVKL